MKEKIETILQEIENFSAQSKEQVEEYRIKWLSKKGEVTVLFDDFKNVAPELKREFGAKLNELKNKAQEKINELKEKFESQTQTSFQNIDLSLPAQPIAAIGSLHPINIVKKEITKIFEDIGFTLSEGREIEDDWHNFTALNTPEDHPARDMQDTFYIQTNPEPSHLANSRMPDEKTKTNPEIVLRTQTSSVQVHLMENNKPPIRTISPGRVYRNETVSARSHCQFHQIEGLYIDSHVSFADLKQTILYFAQRFFGAETKIRLRPSFFPFTEPSAEVDISCTICKGEGCNICKHSGWLEILGCGMVDPQVLTNCGIDATKYTGFAFGMGIERIAMLKYKITDIRLFFENDIRFLKQFQSA